MKIYRIAAKETKEKISIINGGTTSYKVHYVTFMIGNKRYSYILSFPEWLRNVYNIQREAKKSMISEGMSPEEAQQSATWKAHAWAKKKASSAYEVDEQGNILREVGKENTPEPEPETEETEQLELTL